MATTDFHVEWGRCALPSSTGCSPSPYTRRSVRGPRWSTTGRRAPEPTGRDLAERESACCSFFTFTFTGKSGATMRIEVPAAHIDVLDALTGKGRRRDGPASAVLSSAEFAAAVGVNAEDAGVPSVCGGRSLIGCRCWTGPVI